MAKLFCETDAPSADDPPQFPGKRTEIWDGTIAVTGCRCQRCGRTLRRGDYVYLLQAVPAGSPWADPPEIRRIFGAQPPSFSSNPPPVDSSDLDGWRSPR
jgi:hypothetical protein